jgi:hypothetical protein
MKFKAKKDIETKVESFIFNKLSGSEYEISEISSNKLLTWNRLDLGFKLAYLDLAEKCPDVAKEIYSHDIKAQTLGKFTEYGNEGNKNSFDHYLRSFSITYNNIKNNGFLKEKTLIPLSIDGTIINGAHRLASAIHLNESVTTIVTEQSIMVADYQYFFERDVPVKCIETIVQKFIQFSNDNVHIAFLWPSGNGHKDEAENLFSKIVYKKKISLTPKGAFNLLYELYKHMDWVGTKSDGYNGIKQKLIECFPKFDSFQVIVFQSVDLEKVQAVKERVRNIYKIGYSSIHITDTKEEAIRISQLLFNDNGLHFLNNSQPNKYTGLYEKLDEFKMYLSQNNIDPSDVVIDGSLTLTLYGLRKNTDVDFLVSDNAKIEYPNEEFETHDSELKYHGKDKADLIYDDKNYFVFYNLKFISFSQLYDMKFKRNEEKDRNDCLIMKSSLEGSSYNKIMAQAKQKVFYMKIKLHRSILTSGMNTLKLFGLYAPVRFFYRKLKGFK